MAAADGRAGDGAMIIVDTALRRREVENRQIRVGMIGAGFMARGLALQIVNSVAGMRLVAVANRTLAHAERVCTEAGVTPVIAESAQQIDAAIRGGRTAILQDPFELLAAEQLDCVVDVTGAVEFGARVTIAAIERAIPIVTMNAELDGTVGPLLAHLARKAGVIMTGADGDQPAVQANLLRFVQGLGITPLVAGNVKGLQDPYRTPTTQKCFAERWGQGVHMVTSFADGTKVSFEQAVVANAFGFTVGRRGMYGRKHTSHIDELTEVYDVDELLTLGGVVDYVVGAKPGPGVYVLGIHEEPRQRHYLELYKMGKGPLYSFYTPYHLCHFEVPNTIARAVDFADTAITAAGGPRVDVVATAKQDLRTGQTLDGLGGYDTYGVAESHLSVRSEGLLLMGVAEGCILKTDVPKDAVLSYDDVTVPPGRLIDRLLAEQQRIFG